MNSLNNPLDLNESKSYGTSKSGICVTSVTFYEEVNQGLNLFARGIQEKAFTSCSTCPSTQGLRLFFPFIVILRRRSSLIDTLEEVCTVMYIILIFLADKGKKKQYHYKEFKVREKDSLLMKPT